MKQYTDITILLDRSGSMALIKEPMETAFNKFLEEHKAVPSTRITLIQFDDRDTQHVVYMGVPVKYTEKLTINPRGNTPLLDALCQTIDTTGRRLSEMNEADRPDQVLLVIITDGQENASKTFKRQDVFNRVTKQRESYKWQFVYLGANQDAFAEAASLGIPPNWSLQYSPSAWGVAGASQSLMSNTLSYVTNDSHTRGLAVQSFSPSQRAAADDTTNILGEPTSTVGEA